MSYHIKSIVLDTPAGEVTIRASETGTACEIALGTVKVTGGALQPRGTGEAIDSLCNELERRARVLRTSLKAYFDAFAGEPLK